MDRDIDQLYDVARWYLSLKETNNDSFLPLYADEHRYLVLMGGGGSGKSIFAGRKILERATSEAGHRFLVVRKVGRTLRESCFKQLQGQLGQYYKKIEYKVNKTDMSITFANGSEILFSGLDDVEKLKSIYNVTGIWIEEASELLESDFNQLDIRLRGETAYYKQILITFNPISILHWLKKRFFDRTDPQVRTHRSTYKDNRFLDDEAIRVLESFKETDEYYYTVYCLGEWGVTGKTVFNAKAIAERLALKIRPEQIGYFEYDYDNVKIEKIRFCEEERSGFLKVYKKPEHGAPYVIGADTAGDGSDSFVAQVLDNRTGEQVAILRHTFDEDLFAKSLYCLGKHYNTALIGVETNFSTYVVMELSRLGYERQYVRETLDDYTKKPKRTYGFRTDKNSRNVIISGLVQVMRESAELVSDETTLQEMLTFVRNEQFRPEAEEGAHDDCVMALAIAHYIRPHQSYTAKIQEPEKKKWTKDMIEDYRRASKEGKEYLIKKWGQPK